MYLWWEPSQALKFIKWGELVYKPTVRVSRYPPTVTLLENCFMLSFDSVTLTCTHLAWTSVFDFSFTRFLSHRYCFSIAPIFFIFTFTVWIVLILCLCDVVTHFFFVCVRVYFMLFFLLVTFTEWMAFSHVQVCLTGTVASLLCLHWRSLTLLAFFTMTKAWVFGSLQHLHNIGQHTLGPAWRGEIGCCLQKAHRPTSASFFPWVLDADRGLAATVDIPVLCLVLFLLPSWLPQVDCQGLLVLWVQQDFTCHCSH